MIDKKKKMAAAIAAVNAYRQEEEAAAQQAAAASSVTAEIGVSQWSFSGRQEMMAMRRLVQLRVFDRMR
ncbi:MAG: hypothetical protein ACK5PS_03115 [Desulfopila sp.]